MRWKYGIFPPLCCMMVVGLGAAAYCSMGKSLRWKGSQRRSARAEKGDDRYLLVRKLRPKRRTCFYAMFHLYFQNLHLTYKLLKFGWCSLWIWDAPMSWHWSVNWELWKTKNRRGDTVRELLLGNWKSLYETNLSLANIFGLYWPRFEACPQARLPTYPPAHSAILAHTLALAAFTHKWCTKGER
jgi:hypothetical protein